MMLLMRLSDATVGVFEAKTRLSELLERVVAGESIVITRHGQPIARLIPYETTIDAPSVRAAMDKLAALRRTTVRKTGGLTAAAIRAAIQEGRR